MRDRLEEPFEFRVRTQSGFASSRRPWESIRAVAFVLALGVSILCAVFWPSTPRSALIEADVQTLATTSKATEEYIPEVCVAPRGSYEDKILNERCSDLDDVSQLKFADVSLFDEEEADSLDADGRPVAKNPVASISYEERQRNVPTASEPFETSFKEESNDELEEDETTQNELKSEESVVENERSQGARTDDNARAPKSSRTPGYFARAANLPGRHNSFSLRNFARATDLIDPDDAYSPRSITDAAQVDDLEIEAR